jgi:cell division protease FtsH
LAVHTADKPLAGDVDLADVARRTPGLSGADLFRVCNEAALAGVRLKKKSVDAECFDAAIELVALGRERTSALITSRDREITAWHEAGHAVVALMLSEMEDPVAVSIVPRGPAGGVTWMGTSDDMYVSKNQALAQIACMLGGRLAEEILLGPGGCTQGASNDLEKATAIAESLVSRLGMTSRGLAVGRRDDDATRRAVDDVLTDAYERTRLLLTDNSSLLSATAAALLAEDRLNAKELVELRSRHAASPVSLGSFRPVPPVPTVASAPPLAPVQPAPIRPNRVRLRTRRSVADSVRSLLPSRRRFKA